MYKFHNFERVQHVTVNEVILYLKFKARPFARIGLNGIYKPGDCNGVFLANWKGAVTSRSLGCIFINPYYYET